MTHILIIGRADRVPTPFDNEYVAEYDPIRPGVSPNGRTMQIHLRTTPDITKAREFATVMEAWECWKMEYGVREDGRPNRPLTAFSVTFE